MGNISAKAQEEIQKAVEAYPKKWTHGICAFGLFDPEKGIAAGCRNASSGDVCHASLVPWGGAGGFKDVIVVNAHKNTWQKDHPEYLLWAATDNPFKHGVLNRDNKDEILNHATVIDTREVGRGGALWVCKAIRHFTEDKWVIPTWEKLREYGLTGLQAFIGADILDSGGNPKPGATHTGLFGYNTPQKLRTVYDEILGIGKIENHTAVRTGVFNTPSWGSLKGKTVKKPDGWGGFIEKQVPGDAKDYAQALKEIFEGDPKNVD
jgi:hypothetical protein